MDWEQAHGQLIPKHKVKNILVCHTRNHHVRHQENFATRVDTEVALRDRF